MVVPALAGRRSSVSGTRTAQGPKMARISDGVRLPYCRNENSEFNSAITKKGPLGLFSYANCSQNTIIRLKLNTGTNVRTTSFNNFYSLNSLNLFTFNANFNHNDFIELHNLVLF